MASNFTCNKIANDSCCFVIQYITIFKREQVLLFLELQKYTYTPEIIKT